MRFLLRPVKQPVQRICARFLNKHWEACSRLIPVSDSPFWVLHWEMRELVSIARRIGIHTADPKWLTLCSNQTVFFASHLQCLSMMDQLPPHRLATTYYHGRPGTGIDEFDEAFRQLQASHERLERIQVTCSEIQEIVLSSGINPEKVFLIPIGINLSYFQMQTPEMRQSVRQRYEIPQSAAVVGSFQKDGVGWGEGLEPKLIKGPDVFLNTVEILRARIPELFVLLSGPARGYVKAGLERLNVPYRHVLVKHYPDIGQLFQALDLYIVASRQEGGPKAVLETMASGVPLVTTRVGQAMDLVRHGENAFLAEVEDVEGLAHWAEQALLHRNRLDDLISQARRTAETHAYEKQTLLWKSFMQGFVQWVE